MRDLRKTAEAARLDKLILVCAKQSAPGRWANTEDIGYGG